jgi:hypothetical protein
MEEQFVTPEAIANDHSLLSPHGPARCCRILAAQAGVKILNASDRNRAGRQAGQGYDVPPCSVPGGPIIWSSLGGSCSLRGQGVPRCEEECDGKTVTQLAAELAAAFTVWRSYDQPGGM